MQWTERTNQNSLSGVRYDAYRSVPDCQDYCASEPRCVAIDFNFDDNSCWLHLDAANLVDVYDQFNTNQYRIERECVTLTSTTTTTTTTATTTASTTLTTTGSPR